MQIERNARSLAALIRSTTRLNCKVASLALLFVVAGAALGSAQQQQPPLVPLSQGTTTSRAQSAANAASTTSGSASPVGPMSNVGALTDSPIFPGETVHVLVFDAPDFSILTQVSGGGDIAVPMVGPLHIAGLNSVQAGDLIAQHLSSLNLVTTPHVAVTVDTQALGITVLGEVHSPGIYQPMGKERLSDVLAQAGGMTANTGRVIEISNTDAPDKKIELAWDPTLHNTSGYDTPVHAGDRVYVKPCGIAYVGGNVGKPGAYSLCGSRVMTISELVDMASGVMRLTNESHTYLIRTRPDGTRVAMQVNIGKIERAKEADLPVQEDDIVYVSPSALKFALAQLATWTGAIAGPLVYTQAR